VCGLEVLSLVDPASVDISLVLNEDSDFIVSAADLMAYFSNDSPSCPITEIRLTSDTSGAAVSNSQGYNNAVSLNGGGDLTVLNNIDSNQTYTFYIEASTGGDVKAYKTFSLETIKRVNLAPTIASIPDIQITMTGDDQLLGLSEPILTYNSPTATDAESDPITLTISGGASPCNCISVASSGATFSVQVDKTEITIAD